MIEIGKRKDEIIEALNNIARITNYQNSTGRFDINKDADFLLLTIRFTNFCLITSFYSDLITPCCMKILMFKNI